MIRVTNCHHYQISWKQTLLKQSVAKMICFRIVWINVLAPFLFTNVVAISEELIKKSINDGHTIGLVSTSQGSYWLNSTLDEYLEGNVEYPFAWTPPTLDDIDFLQLDFRVPHEIHTVKVILNPFEGDNPNQLPQFYCALSKDGINWQLNVDENRILNIPDEVDKNSNSAQTITRQIGGTKARYVRFYSLGSANDTTEWSFLVDGEATTDYTQFSTSDYTMPCHGYQARIDYSVVAATAHENCDDAIVRVMVDGKEDAEFMEKNSHAVYWKTLSMEKFHKCVFSLVIEAFQSTQNASYQLSVEMPNLNGNSSKDLFTSEVQEFGVSDDGVPDENLLYIVTEGGNYFVSAANYSTFKPDLDKDPVVYLGNMDTIRQACIENRDNADVLDISLFDHFQAGGTNKFMETLMHQITETGFAKEMVNNTFLLFQQPETKQCLKMNEQFEIDIYECIATQHKVDFIFCLHTEGEISSIQINSTDCLTNTDNTCVTLELEVMAILMGARVPRNLTCTARDFQNQEIMSQRKILEVWNRQVAKLSVQMCFADGNGLISKVSCSANRKLVTSEENPIQEVGELELPQELDDDQNVQIMLENLDTPRGGTPNNQNVFYLKKYNYGQNYEIVMNTSGYPVDEFEGAFEKKYGTRSGNSKTNLETVRKFICQGQNKIVIESKGIRKFESLQPEDSGRYIFSAVTLSTSSNVYTSSVSVELVHPFEINCAPSCDKMTLIGRPFEITCHVDHHLLTQTSEFNKADRVPLKVKIGKMEKNDGLDMNPCEYNLPVNTTLTSDDIDSWNLKLDEDKRQLEIKFKIKSFQSWHVGFYYISVEEQSPQNCYYAPNKTSCDIKVDFKVPEECPEVSTDSLSYLVFEAVAQLDVGLASADVNGLCSKNPRAMYFADPTGENQARFYYKICDYVEEDRIEVEKVCGADGGEVVDMGRDYVTNVILNSLLNGLSDFTYDDSRSNDDSGSLSHNEPGVDLIEAWEVLACNFKFQNADSSDMKDYEMKYFTFNGGSVVMMEFKNQKFQFTNDLTGKTGLMCRYRRGYSWDIYAPGSNCRYEPLDINQGLAQRVVMKTHGNLKVSFLCEAIPFGTFQNVTYRDIEGEEGLVYTLKYPDELDVEKIRCIQLHNKTIFGSVDPVDFEWKVIEFSSTPLRLNVRDYVEDDGLWCAATNFSLAQPCYDKTIRLTACVEGNPLQSCRWERHNTGEEHKLENGTDGVSWDMIPDEPEQCNNTRKCSTLTFDSFRRDQQGFYYFECFSGTEEIDEMPEPLRKTSKTVKIYSQQSSPEGSRQISFFINCEEKTMRGFLRLYGPKVNATVQCKHSTNGDWEDYPVRYEAPGPSAWDITFDLERATRESVCEFTGANEFKADIPIKFQTSLKKLDIVNTVVMNRDAFDEKRFCCSICAFEVTKPEDLPIKCNLGEPTNPGREIPLSNVTQPNDFVFSEFSTTRCVTLKFLIPNTFSCSCMVGKLSSALTVRGSGAVEILTPPPVTEPKFMTLKLKEATTPPHKKLKTDPPPTTTESSYTIVYKNKNDYLLEQTAEEINRLSTKPQVVYTEFYKSTKQVEMNVRQNPPKDVIQHTVEVLQNTRNIRQFTTNETQVTREKLDDMADKLVTSLVDLTDRLLTQSPDFAADEEQVMPCFEHLLEALLHVGKFFPANKTLDYHSKYMNARVNKLPENLDDLPPEGIEKKEIDHGGVTKNAIQGVKVSRDVLKSQVRGGSVVAVIFVNQVVKPRQKKQHEESSDNTVMHIFVKRVADIVLVKCHDPDGNQVNLEVNYDLNLYEAREPESTEGQYSGEFVLICMYYNNVSSLWSSNGLRVVFQDHSRGSCASEHTTAFSILAQMKSYKSDGSGQHYYHWMVWIGFIPASLLIAGCFIFLLYIHEALEQEQEEENIRRLFTLLAFQIFLCSYLAGADRTDKKGACAVSQIALHSSMLSVLGCLLNEIIFLLKEVTPSLWKKQYFPLIYLLNTVVLPFGFGIAGFILSMSDDDTHYSCFFPFDTLRAYFLIYAPMVLILLLGGVVLHRLIYRNAYKLSRQMEEYDIPDELEFTIKVTVRILFPFPPLFVLYVYIMNQENAFLHVLMGLLGLGQAILLMLVFVTSPIENQAAWYEMKNSHLNPKRKINKKAKLKQQVTQNQYNAPDDGRASKSPAPGKPQSAAVRSKPRRGLLAEEELEFSDSERSTLSALSNDFLDSGSSRTASVRSGRST